MGMTIEENIATLKEHLNTLNVDKGLEFYQEIESIQSAIEILRKYQKIQDIYLKWNRNYGIQTSSAWTEVIEVVEDGNDKV